MARILQHILKLMDKAGKRAVEVKSAAEAEFNKEAQERLSHLAWAKIEASWYKDGDRVTNNWPGSSTEFKRRLENPVFDHFNFTHPIPDN